MENIRRVTDHLATRISEGQTCLTLVPTAGGGDFYIDDGGEYWRMFHYIGGARSCDSIPSLAHAREAAAEFGRFQAMLHDLPGPRLNETIPDFHNTPARYAQFHEAREFDEHGRASKCAQDIERALAFEQCAASLVELHQAGQIPERITHNDTKINNVLFDVDTDKAICVIDLDTVMPGLSLYDFGDLVRTATTPAAEDETDLSKITMHLDYYEALVEGYLDATAGFLGEVEVENLALAGKIITIETGLRFLTDYLSGDTYFRTDRPEQNLDRCRAQFALAASIDEQLDEMQRLTLEACGKRR
jgi:aminoglycoside phosphotransferase (APT) family kinase protein